MKVRAMEQRLCEWPAGADGAPRAISRLEGQIEEQKQLRLQDAKQVEAKAARIKEWVTNKLRELELQNQQLREQNDRCNQQLELLRNHIATQGTRNSALPVVKSTEPHYSTPVRHRRNLSIGTTNLASTVPGPPAPLTTMNRTMDERTTASLLADDLAAAVENLVVLPTTPNTSTDGDTTHDYAEIYTPSRERTPAWQGNVNVIVQGNSRAGSSTGDSSVSDQPRPPTPPLHRFPSWEAKIYQVYWSYTGRVSVYSSVSNQLRPPTPPLHRFPSWEAKIYQVPAYTGRVSVYSTLSNQPRPPTPPLHRFPSWEAKIYQVPAYTGRVSVYSSVSNQLRPPTPTLHRFPSWEAKIYQVPAYTGRDSVYSTVSDQPRPPTPPLHRFPSWEAKIYQVPAYTGRDSVYSSCVRPATTPHSAAAQVPELGGQDIPVSDKPRPPTPPLHRFPSWEAKIYQVPAYTGRVSVYSTVSDQPRPPTPPLHRFPSWEAKIYQVADDGLQQSVEEELSPPPCPRPMHESTSYQDISVPVYATVKGRASQIRSMPFTGDSSDDSSDGEESMGVTVHNTPHHQLVSNNPVYGGTSNQMPINNVNLTSVLPASIQQTSHGIVLNNTANGQCSSSDTSLSASSPSKSVKTSSSLSPAKRSSSGSPSKQSKTRDTSFESGMSDDYAIPPDAVSCDSMASPSLASLGRVQPATDSPRRHDALEKSGHLAKLGGKLKTWRKRWFVLKNGTLSYWKSQSEVNRKPQGQIGLGEACKISRNEGAATFEIFTGSRTYYLTADSNATMEDWIRVLQNVQRRNATKLLLSKEDNKPTIQGWLTKVKNGHAKKSWCVLIGKMFLYFKSPGDQNPTGQINMRDARVEDVEHVSDSDSEEKNDDTRNHLTVAIYPQQQGPTYLLFECKADKDSWLYHLTVVSGGGLSQGTHFEQLVQKLMETDGDPNCVLWRHPTLLYSKENITSPLTSLNSEALQAEALKLFKCVQLFMSVAVEHAGIDYHVVLAQNALQQCLEVAELQDELVSCLAKQTTAHTATKHGVQVTPRPARRAPKLNVQAAKLKHAPLLSVDCKSNPPTYSFVQGWQLLALAVSLFVPRNNRLLWYLKLHLTRHSDSKTECGKYAAYCSRALERTIRNGGREDKPSRMEVLSILLKNPYHHCLPHAIPVHMLNNTYQVISFDGSTTVEEFLQTLSTELGCRDSAQSGFALFSDDPIEKDLEHHIKPDKKVSVSTRGQWGLPKLCEQ
ncbi:PH domain-containing protein [Phthorimaea operculella]|nr:PH domain-containing protein [Phthorimaea operculella]